MAAGVTVANHVKYLLGTKAITFASDVFKIILMQSGYTFDVDDDELYATVSGSELATANGYTAGGFTLTGVAVTEDDTDNRTEVTWNSATWVASGTIGPSPGAIVYDDTVANDPILMYIDFGGDMTQAAGGTATIANIEFRIA